MLPEAYITSRVLMPEATIQNTHCSGGGRRTLAKGQNIKTASSSSLLGRSLGNFGLHQL